MGSVSSGAAKVASLTSALLVCFTHIYVLMLAQSGSVSIATNRPETSSQSSFAKPAADTQPPPERRSLDPVAG